ncbi:MAG: hypothetical protein WCA77_07605 [Thermoplasmata archaeon]
MDHALFLAEWALNPGGSRKGSIGARLARARLLSHPELVTWCREARLRADSTPGQRRLELLEKQSLDAQLQNFPAIARANARIERKIFGFRPQWKGRRVPLSQLWDLISREPDPVARRAGYYANEPLFASLEPEVRELLAAQNIRARELGFPNYPEARLSLEGLSVKFLRRLLEPFPTLGLRASLAMRDRAGGESWCPWDMMLAQGPGSVRAKNGFLGRDCLPAVRHGLRAWGFGTEDLSFRFQRYDTPLAGQAIIGDAPRDVGVIANPRDGPIYYSILFHEMGHGIHGRSVRGSSHLVRSLGFGGFDESIGGLFESIASDRAWLQTRPGVSREQAARMRRESFEGLAFRMAELVGEVRSELRLYSDPNADLREERKRYLKQSLGYDDHEPISWVDPYYLSPGFYRQSYVLASCFDEQVSQAGLRAVGGDFWPNPRLGPWLKKTWLRPGQRDEWVPKVLQVTGKPLGPEAFVEAIRRET